MDNFYESKTLNLPNNDDSNGSPTLDSTTNSSLNQQINSLIAENNHLEIKLPETQAKLNDSDKIPANLNAKTKELDSNVIKTDLVHETQKLKSNHLIQKLNLLEFKANMLQRMVELDKDKISYVSKQVDKACSIGSTEYSNVSKKEKFDYLENLINCEEKIENIKKKFENDKSLGVIGNNDEGLKQLSQFKVRSTELDLLIKAKDEIVEEYENKIKNLRNAMLEKGNDLNLLRSKLREYEKGNESLKDEIYDLQRQVLEKDSIIQNYVQKFVKYSEMIIKSSSIIIPNHQKNQYQRQSL